MENTIEITGADLVEAVKAAYDLSVPVGMGHLHYREGSLSNEEAATFVHIEREFPVSLDYVLGRACKFTVFQKDDRLYIDRGWYDHTDSQQAELLRRIGIVDGQISNN